MVKAQIDPRRIGEEFQERTKYLRHRMACGARWDGPVSAYKSYPSTLPRVALPAAQRGDGPRLWETIAARRSVRTYGSRPLPLQELSQLLRACQGVAGNSHGYRPRAAPSAGALYPVETYVVAHNVQTLERGLYHYDVREHQLTRLHAADLRADLAAAALGQQMCGEAAVVFVWTAVVGRSSRKYAQRAYRYIYLDAGHIAQNLALAAVGLGLGCCAIGALFDDEINDILGVDGHEETVIYMSAVGPLA